jgi:hypothetical protein
MRHLRSEICLFKKLLFMKRSLCCCYCNRNGLVAYKIRRMELYLKRLFVRKVSRLV